MARDIVILGKAIKKEGEPPQVVYCGRDRSEAVAASAAKAGELPYQYEVNPLPFCPVKLPAVPKPVEAEPSEQKLSKRKK